MDIEFYRNSILPPRIETGQFMAIFIRQINIFKK